MLKNYEHQLLSMNFEEMLREITQIPYRYLVEECKNLKDKIYATDESGKYDHFLTILDDEKKKNYKNAVTDEITLIDTRFKTMKMPSILLERLKKEFDESHKLS